MEALFMTLVLPNTSSFPRTDFIRHHQPLTFSILPSFSPRPESLFSRSLIFHSFYLFFLRSFAKKKKPRVRLFLFY